MDTFTTKRIILMLFNILIVTTAQMCLKYGMVNAEADLSGGIFSKFLVLVTIIFTKPYVFVGFALFGFSSLMWLNILRTTPLSVAYPTVALSYVLTTLLSWRLYGEHVTLVSLSGLFLICCGVVLVGVGLVQTSAH